MTEIMWGDTLSCPQVCAAQSKQLYFSGIDAEIGQVNQNLLDRIPKVNAKS